MDGLEKIMARISEDAQQEFAALRTQTEEQLGAIGAEFQAKAAQEREEILTRGRKAAEERLERLNSAAKMEKRKMELAAKQEVLAEAFDRALENLCSLTDEKYIQLLTQLALKASVSGTEQMIFSQKDRARVGKQVVLAVNEAKNARLTLSEEIRPIQGGFIMVDGDVETNCAFETLVRLQQEKLELEVAGVLFP